MVVIDDLQIRELFGMIVIRADQPSENRFYAERREEIAAHPKPFGGPDFARLGQIEAMIAPGEDARERLLTLPDLVPLGEGEVRISRRKIAGAAMVVIDDPQIGELRGVIDREQSKLDCVDQLKDRRVCAYSKRKGERRNREKATIQSKQSRSVA